MSGRALVSAWLLVFAIVLVPGRVLLNGRVYLSGKLASFSSSMGQSNELVAGSE